MKKLRISLLALRWGVAVVMLLWTADKFIAPEHTARVWAHFYKIDGVSEMISYGIGTVQLVIVLMFLFGIKKRISYGLVLLLHSVSTLSSYKMYLKPLDVPNILFFTAWPMLAACFALYTLRDYDEMLIFRKSK